MAPLRLKSITFAVSSQLISLNLYRVKFPAACGESALCGWVFDTPLLAAG
jgi:hypothetical protein